MSGLAVSAHLKKLPSDDDLPAGSPEFPKYRRTRLRLKLRTRKKYINVVILVVSVAGVEVASPQILSCLDGDLADF